jgi:hypothetical protein
MATISKYEKKMKPGDNIAVTIDRISTFNCQREVITYRGVVCRSEKLDRPNTINIDDGYTIGGKKYIRNVDLKYAVDVVVNGKKIDTDRLASEKLPVEVTGSKGNKYTVSFDTFGQPKSCTCPQFTYRKQVCKHMNLFP